MIYYSLFLDKMCVCLLFLDGATACHFKDLPVDLDAEGLEDLAGVLRDGFVAAGGESKNSGACSGETYTEEAGMRCGSDATRHF